MLRRARGHQSPLPKVALGGGSSRSFGNSQHSVRVSVQKVSPSVRPTICIGASEKRILMKFGIGSYY
jgi:hypothetical protein